MYAAPVQRLVDELSRLPGIGPKSAQRLAFYLLQAHSEDARSLADAIVEAREKVVFCSICFNVSEEEVCALCSDDGRDGTRVCIVQEPPDIAAIERTREYRGLYHVLGGAISPIEGVGPDDLHITELLERINRPRTGRSPITEVIVATNPNVEGEATAMYLARLIEPLNVEVTRLASGLPVGGDLEYADEVTLGRALEGRRRISS